VSARKIGFLILLLCFGGIIESAWQVRQSGFALGPEGCRVLGGRFYGPSYTFEETEERTLAGTAAARVEVRNEFGDVSVEPGEEGLVQVKLRKVVYQPTEEKARVFADRVSLSLTVDGDRVRVETNRGEVGRRHEVGFETHLEVRVPASSTVETRDDHGNSAVRGVASATVRSSFGDVRVGGVTGPVSVEARHGRTALADLGAKTRVDARHGDVEVDGVAGPAVLKVEHGAVRARRTADLDVRVTFGGLTARDVEGDLTAVSSHGAIEARDVSGKASAEASFGGIHLAGISGDARARSERGSVTATGVGGGLVVETKHAGVELDRVDGPVEVSIEEGGLEARELRGATKVRAKGGDVSIHGFGGALDVTVERASARLEASAPFASSVAASANSIHLVVPAKSAFDLDAASEHGRVRLDLPDLEGVSPDPQGRSRATATVGGGGAPVVLRASGDVVVESRPDSPRAEAEE